MFKEFQVSSLKKNFAGDFKSGITVFLVSIPLCLGIALASGVPVMSGLLSGVIGGIVVGFFSNSQLSVSGPAVGLVAIVLTAVAELASLPAFFLAVFLAGILQIIMGYLKAGVIGHFIPSSVIKGMLAAVGLILILKQIPYAIGYEYLANIDSLDFLTDDHSSNTFTNILHFYHYINMTAMFIAILTFVLLRVFGSKSALKYKFFRFIPASLLVIIIAALINLFLTKFLPSLSLAPDFLANIEDIDLTSIGSVINLPDFSYLGNILVYKFAIIIAIVASIETLLSIEAGDKLDKEKRSTSTTQELKAQGIGNTIAGLVGALPITSVIVRTSVNIENNARSKVSTIIHGVLLAISLFIASDLINAIPLASLSVILIIVGYKLINEKIIKSMFKQGLSQFIPFLVTVLAVFFTDLLLGVLVGLLVSLIFIFKQYYYLQNFKLNKNDNVYTFSFSEYVSFINKASLHFRLSSIPKGSEVVFDFSKLEMIDNEIKYFIKDYIDSAKDNQLLISIIQSEKIKLFDK